MFILSCDSRQSIELSGVHGRNNLLVFIPSLAWLAHIHHGQHEPCLLYEGSEDVPITQESLPFPP